MEKMTLEDFADLKHGDTVFKDDGASIRSLRFVGIMPDNINYLIFCRGEYLTYLYLPKYANNWWIGEYNPKFIGKLLIARLNAKIRSIKAIYFNQ